MCIQVAEMRAIEAEEEQCRTEQELASARSELDILQSQNQAAISQLDNIGHLHARTEELARAESALLSVKAELDKANQRIHQLQQPASGQTPFLNRQQPAVSGQMYPDGLSRLPNGVKGRHSGLPSGAASDSSASSHEDTAQAMEVSNCRLPGHQRQCTYTLRTMPRTTCARHGQHGFIALKPLLLKGMPEDPLLLSWSQARQCLHACAVCTHDFVQAPQVLGVRWSPLTCCAVQCRS